MEMKYKIKRSNIYIFVVIMALSWIVFYLLYVYLFNSGENINNSVSQGVFYIKSSFLFFPIFILYYLTKLSNFISLNEERITIKTYFSEKSIRFNQINNYSFHTSRHYSCLRIHYIENLEKKVYDLDFGYENMDQIHDFILSHISHENIKDLDKLINLFDPKKERLKVYFLIIFYIIIIIIAIKSMVIPYILSFQPI